MPDHIATLATLLLIGGIVAGVALGMAAGWLWTRALGEAGNSHFGVAVGLLVFGLATGWVALAMWDQTRLRSGHIVVQGRLIDFQAEKLRENRSGQKLMTRAPVVRFTLPDGQSHQVVGLGGSLQRREPGSLVEVHVDPRDPGSALIGDFQNLYSALGLFALFASVSLLTALHSGIGASLERQKPGAEWPRPQPPRGKAAKKGSTARASTTSRPAAASGFQTWRAGPDGQRWRGVFRRMAMGTALLSIVAIFFTAEMVFLGRAFALTGAGLATAVALGGAASVLDPTARPLMSLFGTFIAVLGVGGFAAWLWLLTAF